MNKEQEKYFKSIVRGHTRQEISDLFYKKYNKKLTLQQVKYYKQKFNLKCENYTTYNKKGIGEEYVEKTSGYVYIKTNENKWVYKHRYVWEKHNGKIPDNYSVIFLDGDKTNCNIDNLYLIKNSEASILRTHKLMANNKELTKLGILTAKLMSKTANKRRILNGNN